MLWIDHLSAIVVLDVSQVFLAISPVPYYDSGSIWMMMVNREKKKKIMKFRNDFLFDYIVMYQNHIHTIHSHIHNSFSNV